MKPIHYLVPVAASLTMLATGMASASEELAKQYNCLACHAVDSKMIGPSYKDIAEKYRGDDAAPAMLAEKIKAGGAGNWGQIPMPPNPAVPDEDLNALVSWILGN